MMWYSLKLITLQFYLFIYIIKKIKMLSPQTSIRVQMKSIKKGSLTTSKYRLPFRKDQSEYQKMKSKNNKQQIKSVINSQLDNPEREISNCKESFLEKRSRKSEIQQDEVSIEVSVENKQEKLIYDNLKIYSKQIAVQIEPKISQVPKLQSPQVPKENHETQTQNYQIPKNQQQLIINSVQSKLSIDRTHQFKLQPLQTKANHKEKNTIQYKKLTQQKKKNYRSRSRYADQQVFADISHQSEMTNSHFFITKPKPKEMPRLAKSQRLREVKPALDRSLKKLEKQLWQILLSLNQQQQIDWVIKKRKKSKFKKLKRKLEQPKQSNKTQLSVQKFPELSQRKTIQQSMNIDYDIYDQLPSIQQNIIKPQFFRGQSDSVINKLHSLIELKQKSKKRNITLPMQKYLQECQFINKVNPFFRKLNQFGGCLLLSIGKLMFLDYGNLIFNQGETISHLCIIILGKVLLTQNFNDFKHYSIPGESLGEEALFDQTRPYNLRIFSNSKCIEYKAQAKAITKVCLLKISLRKYYKLSIELNSAGEKWLFNLIDNLFKINYLKKNAVVHNQLKSKLQTDILARRKTEMILSQFLPKSQYYYQKIDRSLCKLIRQIKGN